MVFYFDWFNNPIKEDLLKLLWTSKWTINKKTISVKNGFNEIIDNNFKSEFSDITGFQDINLKTDKIVGQFMENHFCTITEDIIPERIIYPDELINNFNIDDLDTLKEELYWIGIELPEIFPVEYLVDTFCALNAFPVLNKRIHESNRPYTINEDLNISFISCTICQI